MQGPPGFSPGTTTVPNLSEWPTRRSELIHVSVCRRRKSDEKCKNRAIPKIKKKNADNLQVWSNKLLGEIDPTKCKVMKIGKVVR